MTKISFNVAASDAKRLYSMLEAYGVFDLKIEEEEIELTQEQIESIEKGLEQVKNGQVTPHKEVMKRAREICGL